MRRLLAVLAAATVLSGAVPAQAGMLDRINDERAERGRPPLVLVRAVSDGAREHSRAMYQADELFHDPDAVRATLDAATVWTLAGENVGHSSKVVRIFRGWMSSDAHRRVLLKARFDHIGIGVFRKDDSGVYVTAYLYSVD